MYDISTKIDNISTLSADEFNKGYMEDLENAVTKSGITLDTVGVPTDQNMLAQAITRASQGGCSYQDSGSANAYVLSAIGGFQQPTAYFDGMIVCFKAGNTNTGASTVNVSSIGISSIVDNSGSALTSDKIIANKDYFLRYDLSNTRFVLLSIGDTDSFLGSAATNGYQYLHNGIIVQWGTNNPSGGNGTIVFPIAFPNNCYNVTSSPQDTTAQGEGSASSDFTTTNFRLTIFNTNTGVPISAGIGSWIAIGD